MERASLAALNNSREHDANFRKDSKISLYQEQQSKLFQSEKHYSSKIFRPAP